MDDPDYLLASLAASLDEIDYYALLGVFPNAGPDEIRQAYHDFALDYHPDQWSGEPENQDLANTVFKRGNEAYRVLCHPILRQRYDGELAQGRVRLSAEGSRLSADADPLGDIPGPSRAFYEKALELLQRGDLGGARLHLTLAKTRGDSPAFAALARQLEAKSPGPTRPTGSKGH